MPGLDWQPQIQHIDTASTALQLPLPPGLASPQSLLALGGLYQPHFCLLQGGICHLSAVMEAEVFTGRGAAAELTADAAARYRTRLPCQPQLLVVDRHADGPVLQWALQWAGQERLALTSVQHHHAHLAACMADNAVPASQQVLGIVLDGGGFGDGGEHWGGELLLADYRNYRRLASLQPLPLIGSLQALREPWRNAYAHIDAVFGWERFYARYPQLPLTHFLADRPLSMLDELLRSGGHCPPSSAAVRWFDAVAAALGLCLSQQSAGQAAIQLETLARSAALPARDSGYSLRLTATGSHWQLQVAPMWPQLLDDMAAGWPAAIVAARFYEGLARGLVQLLQLLMRRHNLGWGTPVALCGGAFDNRLLLQRLLTLLQHAGLRVLVHRRVPGNDRGLALGQAVVAAAQQAA